MRAPPPLLAVPLVLLLLMAGCSADDKRTSTTGTTDSTATSDASSFRVESPDFADGGPMPRAYSCDANSQRQVSPPLNVTGFPANAVSLALILQDPDVPVPEAPTRTLTHWLVWNITTANGTVRFLQDAVPPGAVQGANDFGQGYLGPCPPPGSSAHHYNFTAYALDARIELPAGSDRAALEAAMQGHVLATARLIGTYVRQVV